MIMWKLKNTKLQVNVYVILIATNADQLEILHCSYLQQPYYQEHPPYIVGITSSMPAAFTIIEELTREVYASTGTANLKEYLLTHKR